MRIMWPSISNQHQPSVRWQISWYAQLICQTSLSHQVYQVSANILTNIVTSWPTWVGWYCKTLNWYSTITQSHVLAIPHGHRQTVLFHRQALWVKGRIWLIFQTNNYWQYTIYHWEWTVIPLSVNWYTANSCQNRNDWGISLVATDRLTIYVEWLWQAWYIKLKKTLSNALLIICQHEPVSIDERTIDRLSVEMWIGTRQIGINWY